MRLAAIYDIHGNLPALMAVLKEIESLDINAIVFGGDTIPGPLPKETLDVILHLETQKWFITGNGERETISMHTTGNSPVPKRFHAGLRWCGDQCTSEQMDFLSSLESTLDLEIGRLGEVRFCHATPRNDTEIFTKNTPIEFLQPIFGPCTVSTVVCGHTHMQFDRSIADVRVLNAGSVGMAFGSPDAQWLLLNGDAGTCEFRSTTYDRFYAADQLLKSDYPDAKWFVDSFVRQYPSEVEMLERFALSQIGATA